MMQEQLDLRNEGRNLKKFNELYADNLTVMFPRPMMRFTTKNMLIEEFASGIPISVFLDEARESQSKKEPSAVFDHKIADIGKKMADGCLKLLMLCVLKIACLITRFGCLPSYAYLLQLHSRRSSPW
jgi:hypothetical protein